MYALSHARPPMPLMVTSLRSGMMLNLLVNRSETSEISEQESKRARVTSFRVRPPLIWRVAVGRTTSQDYEEAGGPELAELSLKAASVDLSRLVGISALESIAARFRSLLWSKV